MRLGNLDHLLIKLDAELSDDARYIDIADQIRDIINNAPTVTPNMAQVLAYESGKASVERPQGDLISRKALKISFKEHCCGECDCCVHQKEGFSCELIDNAPTVELDECVIQEVLSKRCMTAVANEYLIALHGKRPQGEWIPCSERLPDEMTKVLVWYEYFRYGDFNCMYQTYGFCYVCDGKWSSFINGETGWTDARIIAWQPLPEPYDSEVHDD